MTYPESSIYTLLSISVVLLGIVFAINYNRRTGSSGLRSVAFLCLFVGASWLSVCVEFVYKLAGLLGHEVDSSMYVFALFHSVALALFIVSVWVAFQLMLKIAVDDSIASRLKKFSRENPVST